MHILAVKQLDYVEKTLIPLFDAYYWHSKKHLDYIDFKTILEIINKGLHYLPSGEALIKRIIGQMNNNRLSTSKTPLNSRESLLKEIAIFLKQPSNYKVNEEGRLFIISLNRYKVDNKAKAVQLVEVENGNLIATGC